MNEKEIKEIKRYLGKIGDKRSGLFTNLEKVFKLVFPDEEEVPSQSIEVDFSPKDREKLLRIAYQLVLDKEVKESLIFLLSQLFFKEGISDGESLYPNQLDRRNNFLKLLKRLFPSSDSEKRGVDWVLAEAALSWKKSRLKRLRMFSIDFISGKKILQEVEKSVRNKVTAGEEILNKILVEEVMYMMKTILSRILYDWTNAEYKGYPIPAESLKAAKKVVLILNNYF